MYELIQVTENTYYIESPAKIGLVRTGGSDVVLIDSGNDKDAGRKVRQHLDAHGFRLKAIYNTHSNADHIGGNQYLQRQTGCAVYAPGVEAAFGRPAVPSTPPAWRRPSPGLRSWNRRFSTAAIRPRRCGTSSSWPSPARPNRWTPPTARWR